MLPLVEIFRQQLFGSAAPAVTHTGTLPMQNWVNEAQRVELPADFPAPLNHGGDIAKIAQVLDAELRKHGTSLEQVDRIHIAYPHKHPGKFPGHDNSALWYARNFHEHMGQAEGPLSKIQWSLLDELVETRRLGRSENQTSVHALTAKQKYAYYAGPDSQLTSTVALVGDNRKEFFVVVDTMSEQGTTFANLISHIRANGGVVLGTVGAKQLVQKKSDEVTRERAKLPSRFTDPSRNTGRLPELALAFARSAAAEGKDWTPAECLEKFETSLKRHGNSVFAMTEGEVTRVIDTLSGNAYGSRNFVKLLNSLDRKAVVNTVLKPFRP